MTYRFPLLELAVVFSGCQARDPLSEVEITGGSDEQVALAEQELLAFDTWTGANRLAISEVRFVELPAGQAGAYRHGSRRVDLSLERPLSELRTNLRHELCHALDDMEHLMRTSNAVFDSHGEALFEYFEANALVVDDFHASAAARRREVFASFCESGPYAAKALIDGCDDVAVDLMEYMDAEVWTGSADLAIAPSVVTVAPITVNFDLNGRKFRVNETRTENVVLVVAGYDSTLTSQPMNVDSGAPYTGSVELALPDPAPALLPGLDVSVGYMVPSGVAASVATVNLFHLGRSIPRWFVDDGDWYIVDDCPADARVTVFTASEQLWRAWADGETIFWRPILD